MTGTKRTGKISATITHQAIKSHFVLITTKRGTSCVGSLASSKDNTFLFFGTLCLTHFIHEQNFLIIFYGEAHPFVKVLPQLMDSSLSLSLLYYLHLNSRHQQLKDAMIVYRLCALTNNTLCCVSESNHLFLVFVLH